MDALQQTKPRTSPSNHGAILIEFAFIAILMYLLVAATIDFGRLYHSAQAVQDATRAAAREISVIPLPPEMTLDEALDDPKVRARVYQPEHLVIDLDNIPGGVTLDEFYSTLPVLNQTLRPLMIFDASGGRRLLRYPGALLIDPSTPSGYAVGIPFVESRSASGVETIRWLPVVEEIQNADFPGQSPFAMNTPAAMPQRGLVAIRINYPFQASMLSGYLSAGSPTTPNLSNSIVADDGAVQQSNAPPDGGVPAGGAEAGPYAGTYGLGLMYAQGQAVRPFRKLLTAQAIFRREVFE